MKLLLVEDDVETAAYLQRALSEAGRAVAAHGGRDGLRLAAGGAHSVRVINRLLPEIDGLAILRTIRAAAAASGIAAALLLSGCAVYHARPLATSPDLGASPQRLTVDLSRLRVQPLKTIRVDPADGLNPLEIAVLAVLNSPELEAKRKAAGVSQAQAFAAGLFPDPQISVGSDKPVSGPDTHTAYNAGLSYDLAGLLARANLRRAARFTARQADLDLLWSEWSVGQQARQLAETALAAERKAAYFRQSAAIAADRDARSNRAFVNHDATAQTSAADLAVKLDAETQLATATHDALKARRDLDALLGLDAAVVLPLVVDPSEAVYDEAAVRQAIATLPARRPDLLALVAGYSAQDTNVRKAIIAQFPLTQLALAYARDPAGTTTQGLSASLFLPVFNGGRGEVRIQNATREQLHAEYQSKLDAADAEAKNAQAELVGARAFAARLRADVPRLEALVKPALAAYDRRDIDSQTYLTLSQSALSRRADLDDKELAARLAEITLETSLFLPPAAARAAP
jgi:outer membrane protein TolC